MSTSTCLFCRIVKGEESNHIYYEVTLLIYKNSSYRFIDRYTFSFQDEYVIVFKDKVPAAEYHFLAIPVEHLADCHDLKPKHIELLKRIKKAGETVLNEHLLNKYDCLSGLIPSEAGAKTVTVPIAPIQAIFGFHVPPYNSQHHLHMHIVAPADTLSIESRERVLGTNCFRFISVRFSIRFLFI